MHEGKGLIPQGSHNRLQVLNIISLFNITWSGAGNHLMFPQHIAKMLKPVFFCSEFDNKRVFSDTASSNSTVAFIQGIVAPSGFTSGC